MIQISNCPDTGLQRKIVAKNLFIYESTQQIILECHIQHFKNGQHVSNARVKDYRKDLVARTTALIDPANPLTPWTQEQIRAYNQLLKDIEDYPAKLQAWEEEDEDKRGPAPVEPLQPSVIAISEYQFFAAMLSKPVNIQVLQLQYIEARDAAGYFDAQ